MLLVSLILSIIGLFGLYQLNSEFAKTQSIWLLLSIIVYFGIKKIGYVFFRSYWQIIYITIVILLILPFFFPEIRSSHRWIVLFGFTVQPSELVKPFFILVLSYLLSSVQKFSLKNTLGLVSLCLIPIFLIYKQPDLGNALIYAFTAIALFFIANLPLRYFVTGVLLSIILLPFAWTSIAPYQKARIETFVNPQKDTQGIGYNALQSLISTGSGGWFGQDMSQSTQSELKFLPEYHTDFIFASTIERIGFLGGLFLIGIYYFLLLLIFKTAYTLDYAFKLFSFGILFMIFFHVFINIAMNIGLLPITGITLPFLSLGGSSLLTLFISIGLLSSVSSKHHQPIAFR